MPPQCPFAVFRYVDAPYGQSGRCCDQPSGAAVAYREAHLADAHPIRRHVIDHLLQVPAARRPQANLSVAAPSGYAQASVAPEVFLLICLRRRGETIHGPRVGHQVLRERHRRCIPNLNKAVAVANSKIFATGTISHALGLPEARSRI